MKTILISHPTLIVPEGYLEITDITYSSSKRECHLALCHGERNYLIVFPDTVAFRVMDEREMGEFWSCNIEYASFTQGSVIFQVEAGGWRGQDSHLDNGIQHGYFGNGKVAEYVVTSHYECLNIISASPTFNEITSDANL
ncbi:hypothetical protein [Herbaspirillum sp. NPDC087042]|uniref:hypothetical protein n=1 Tax=Herbaspirillum sp. NPDC087042 TaxID=3364004 RepID=UPI003810B048